MGFGRTRIRYTFVLQWCNIPPRYSPLWRPEVTGCLELFFSLWGCRELEIVENHWVKHWALRVVYGASEDIITSFVFNWFNLYLWQQRRLINEAFLSHATHARVPKICMYVQVDTDFLTTWNWLQNSLRVIWVNPHLWNAELSQGKWFLQRTSSRIMRESSWLESSYQCYRYPSCYPNMPPPPLPGLWLLSPDDMHLLLDGLIKEIQWFHRHATVFIDFTRIRLWTIWTFVACRRSYK